jgi:aminomuconate-semialdehyde/2-hydroxymuconate-6-semialdehyde dehydrogenase
MMTVRHFINGEWADSAGGATFESVSPIDNTVIAQVARGGVTDADRAVDAARHAFDHGPWPKMNPAARKKILHAAAALIDERREEFAAAETRDMGKPISESRTKDVPRAAECFAGPGRRARPWTCCCPTNSSSAWRRPTASRTR